MPATADILPLLEVKDRSFDSLRRAAIQEAADLIGMRKLLGVNPQCPEIAEIRLFDLLVSDAKSKAGGDERAGLENLIYRDKIAGPLNGGVAPLEGSISPALIFRSLRRAFVRAVLNDSDKLASAFEKVASANADDSNFSGAMLRLLQLEAQFSRSSVPGADASAYAA